MIFDFSFDLSSVIFFSACLKSEITSWKSHLIIKTLMLLQIGESKNIFYLTSFCTIGSTEVKRGTVFANFVFSLFVFIKQPLDVCFKIHVI